MDKPEGEYWVRLRLGFLFVCGNSISIILINCTFVDFYNLKPPDQNTDKRCQHVRINMEKIII